MTDREAVRRLYALARFEKNNRCETCGQQKEHICGMGACVDVCRRCLVQAGASHD